MPTSIIVAAVAATVSGTFAVGALAFSVATFATVLALSAVSGLLAPKVGGSTLADAQQARTHVVRSSTSARTVVYGTAMVSGPLVFAGSSPAGTVTVQQATADYTVAGTTATVTASGLLSIVSASFTSQVSTGSDYYYNGYPLALVTGAPGPGQYSVSGNVVTVNAADVSQFGTTVQVGYTYNAGTTNQQNAYLHMVIALASHQVQGIDEIYLNDALAVNASGVVQSPFAGFLDVTKYLGTATQTADATLIATFPTQWTSAHRLLGVAYLYLRLKYDQSVYPNGVPNVRAVVRGKAVYDPRTATTAFSNNWALCVRDYLTSDFGLGTPAGEIDDATFIAAANSSDEAVALAAGGTQARYTCDGVVDLSNKPLDIMKRLMTAGAGTVVYTQGKYRVFAGVYSAPVATLTESDLRDKLTVQPAVSMKDTYNAVRGTFVNAAQFWQPLDFPPVTNATYQAADGGVQQFRDIELGYTTDSTRAQRIAKIFLEKSRQSIVVQFPAKFTAFKVAVWDRVYLTIAQMGWSNKVFIVTGWKFADAGVDLILQEDASSSYDWNSGAATTYDTAPNTNLPVPGYVPAPTGLVLQNQPFVSNATIVNRVAASWAGQTDAFVAGFDLQYSTNGGVDWINGLRSTATSQVIDGLKVGLLYVRVRGYSYMGNVSAWTTGTVTVAGKTTPPLAVAGLAVAKADTKLLLSWSKSTDVSVGSYEVRTANSGWGTTSGLVFKGDAVSVLVDPPAGGSTVTYYVKAVDYAGNYSASAASVSFTTAAPSTVTGVAAAVSGTQLLVSWSKNAAPSATQFPVMQYEVRTADSGFGTTGASFKGDALQVSLPAPAPGATVTYYVRALDSWGNYSAASGSVSFTASAVPDIAAVTTSFYSSSATSSQLLMSWADVAPQYGLAGYQISWGAVTRTVKANNISVPADWVGDRTFTVKTLDAAGNLSAGFVQIVTKQLPGSPTGFRSQVVDNSVMLYWGQPAVTTLPVSHYLLRKGGTWATATDLGRKDGLFTAIFENAAGTFTYWVATVDTDGNLSTPVSLTAVVAQPPDFTFFGQLISSLGGTLSNAVVSGGAVVLPVNTSETFASHFTSRSWSTPQDQINAGYPVYIQPSASAGYYEEVFDFGTIINSSRISPAFTGTVVAGSPVVSGTISTSPDNVTWTTYSGISTVYATAFRYVRVHIDVTDGSGTGLYQISSLSVTLDAKLKDDAGMAACLSTDTSGTVANFAIEFIDVTAISITPTATTPVIAVYDFKDAVIAGTYSVTSNVCTVNATAHGLVVGQRARLSFSSGGGVSGVYTVVTAAANSYTVAMVTANTSGNVSTYSQGLRIYLFDNSGTRVSGTASWAIKGY